MEHNNEPAKKKNALWLLQIIKMNIKKITTLPSALCEWLVDSSSYYEFVLTCEIPIQSVAIAQWSMKSLKIINNTHIREPEFKKVIN